MVDDGFLDFRIYIRMVILQLKLNFWASVPKSRKVCKNILHTFGYKKQKLERQISVIKRMDTIKSRISIVNTTMVNHNLGTSIFQQMG